MNRLQSCCNYNHARTDFEESEEFVGAKESGVIQAKVGI